MWGHSKKAPSVKEEESHQTLDLLGAMNLDFQPPGLWGICACCVQAPQAMPFCYSSLVSVRTAGFRSPSSWPPIARQTCSCCVNFRISFFIPHIGHYFILVSLNDVCLDFHLQFWHFMCYSYLDLRPSLWDHVPASWPLSPGLPFISSSVVCSLSFCANCPCFVLSMKECSAGYTILPCLMFCSTSKVIYHRFWLLLVQLGHRLSFRLFL